jgi:transposase InsO family protein
VAIDRRSRSVHLAVRDDETEAGATAFLREALAAFPFRVTRVLTDRGSCFTAEGFEKACRELGVEHRKTRLELRALNLRMPRGKGAEVSREREGRRRQFEFRPAASRTFFVEFKECSSSGASYPYGYGAA